MKRSGLFLLLALILSHTACLLAGRGYGKLFCAGEHLGASAPAWLGLLDGLPLLLGALLCMGAAYLMERKSQNS